MLARAFVDVNPVVFLVLIGAFVCGVIEAMQGRLVAGAGIILLVVAILATVY